MKALVRLWLAIRNLISPPADVVMGRNQAVRQMLEKFNQEG
jgi:hypothetical protein